MNYIAVLNIKAAFIITIIAFILTIIIMINSFYYIVDAREKEIDLLKNNLNLLDEENSKLRTRIDELETRINELLLEIRAKEENITELDNRVEELELKVNEYKARLTHLSIENTALRNKNNMLTKQLTTYRNIVELKVFKDKFEETIVIPGNKYVEIFNLSTEYPGYIEINYSTFNKFALLIEIEYNGETYKFRYPFQGYIYAGSAIIPILPGKIYVKAYNPSDDDIEVDISYRVVY